MSFFASTSTSPLARFGFTVPCGRARTVPSTASTYSERSNRTAFSGGGSAQSGKAERQASQRGRSSMGGGGGGGKKPRKPKH